MTTETASRPAGRRRAARPGTRLLLRTAAVTGALGLAAAVVAGLLAGSAAAYGTLVGTAVTVVVLVGGSLLVDLVATVLPAASLLLALLTFTLQVLVVLLVLLGLERSDLLGPTLDRQWLGGAVIVTTMLWLAVQVRLHTTARIPAFDEPVVAPARGDEGGPR